MIKMLLADDEPVILRAMVASIPWEELGIRLCAVCGDGMSAYHAFLDENPDLVLTDIRMSAMSGLDLIRQTRSVSPDTVYMILSGYADFDYARTAMQYGVRYYLLKPCTQERIVETLRSAISDVLAARKKRQMEADYAGLLAQAVFRESEPESTDSEEAAVERVLGMPSVEQARVYAFGLLCRLQGIGKEEADCLPPFGNRLALMQTREEIAAFLMSCLSSQGNGRVSAGRTFVARILHILEKEYADPSLSLKNIAEQRLFMNTDYVSREFLRVTGEKFSAVLIRTRMEHAMRMFREEGSAARVYEVAERVGIVNPQYFAQAFKKYTGYTPTAYMEQIEKHKEGLA